jgi:hypothetical protein
MHFFRQLGGLYHGVHFQANPWGSARSGSFTINLAVTNPELYSAFTERPFPANPATANWPIHERIGFLSPAHRDLWWQVEVSTNFEELGREVAATLVEYAIPFFARYHDSAALLAHALEDKGHEGVYPDNRPLVAAILLTARGERFRAKEVIDAAFQKYQGQPYQLTIARISQHLGLET